MQLPGPPESIQWKQGAYLGTPDAGDWVSKVPLLQFAVHVAWLVLSNDANPFRHGAVLIGEIGVVSDRNAGHTVADPAPIIHEILEGV